jgi:hypothetical protein
MRHSHTPVSLCLNCGLKLSAATDIESVEKPQPGNIAVCIECRHVMVYADDLTLREPNDDEIKELAGHPELLKHMKLLADFHIWRKWRHAQEKKAP